MHVRKQIRDAAVAALTGLATTGANAYAARVYPFNGGNVPGLAVYSRDESAAHDGAMGAVKLSRELPLVVEIVVQGDNPDDALDAIAEEVETALGANPTLSGLARTMLGPVATEIEVGGEDAETPFALMRLEFRYLYSTAQGAPGIAL